MQLVPKSAVQYDWRVARFSRKEALFRQRDMEAGNGPKPPEWTFVDLLRRGLVECVDVNEENDCLVRAVICWPASKHGQTSRGPGLHVQQSTQLHSSVLLP